MPEHAVSLETALDVLRKERKRADHAARMEQDAIATGQDREPWATGRYWHTRTVDLLEEAMPELRGKT